MNHDPKKPSQFAPDTKWYPVRRIQFVGSVLIGGSVCTDLLGDVTQANVDRYTIEYGPSFRHHRVTTLYADPKREPKVTMVPETSVRSWEPLL